MLWIVAGKLIAIAIIGFVAYLFYSSFGGNGGQNGDDDGSVPIGPDEPIGDGGTGESPEFDYIQPAEAINDKYLSKVESD